MKRAALVGIAVTLFLRAGSARADGTSVLNLVVERCPGIDEDRLRELLVIELATVRPRGAGDVDVALACDGARVSMDLRDRALGRSWHAEADLAATPEATRLRLLVLAVTEQWSLPAAEPQPPPAPAPPAALASVPVVARAPVPPAALSAWRLFAKATLRRAGAPGLWLAGAGVGLERAFGRWLGAALDIVGERGTTDGAVATVELRDLVATAGLLVGTDVGRWSLAALPAFRVGLASLAATPRSADARGATLDAVWAGPALSVRARRGFWRAGYLVAEAGTGTTTRRVTGLVDGQTALFELRGAWLELGIGAGLSF